MSDELVINKLRASGDPRIIKEMFEFIKYEEVGMGSIDFNKIIPQPADLYDEPVGTGTKYDKSDWSIENWGVEEYDDGCSIELEREYAESNFDGQEMKFLTLNDTPLKVIKALSKKYPDLTFNLVWTYDDLNFGGSGEREYKNGEETYSYSPAYDTIEAIELSAKILDIKRTDEEYVRELAYIFSIELVCNELRVSGDPQMVEKMLDAIQNEEEGLGSIDFNKIIPVPKDIYNGSLEKAAIEKNNNNLSEWLKDNWGVQKSICSSYSPVFLDNTMWIDTLGGAPLGIIRALSKKYPDLIFELEWGHNMYKYGYGKKRYENGIEVYSYISEEESDEVRELARKIVRY